jgi:hypothetical protein
MIAAAEQGLADVAPARLGRPARWLTPQQRTGVAGTHREIDHAVWAEGQALVRDHAGQSASAMLRDSQRGLGLAVIQLKCEAKIHGLTG